MSARKFASDRPGDVQAATQMREVYNKRNGSAAISGELIVPQVGISACNLL